jgi:hypothetical protein
MKYKKIVYQKVEDQAKMSRPAGDMHKIQIGTLHPKIGGLSSNVGCLIRS